MCVCVFVCECAYVFAYGRRVNMGKYESGLRRAAQVAVQIGALCKAPGHRLDGEPMNWIETEPLVERATN